jgi:hypothetical protein
VSGSNGTKVPNANQRARALERETTTAEANLAQVIARTVAEVLAGMLPQALHQAMQGQPWQPGCLFCVNEHKQAMMGHAVAVQNAQQAAEPPPDPPQVNIQQAITFVPMQPAPNLPPVPVPVCYDHHQAQPGGRPVGLVLPDGTPIVARGA